MADVHVSCIGSRAPFAVMQCAQLGGLGFCAQLADMWQPVHFKTQIKSVVHIDIGALSGIDIAAKHT